MAPKDEQQEKGLTRAELARAAGVDEAFVLGLVERGILTSVSRDHRSSDIYRVRFAALAVRSGISLDDLARSLESGVVRMGDVDVLFPEPVATAKKTHAELALELAVETDLIHRVRLAAGLTTRAPEEPVHPDEEQILRLIVELSRGFGDPETSIRIARNYGERVQRIVVSAVGTYEEYVYGPLLESRPTIDAETRSRVSVEGRSLIDRAESLLTATHRRHMQAAILAMWVRATESQMARHGVVAASPTRPPAIAFVDLSGFTRVTEEQGDDMGMWLASQLVAEAEAAAAAHGADIVKLLGDGVMLHAADPGDLIDTAVALVEALPRAGLPPAHAGVHAGPLIERDGDYFGGTVNVAARIASEAAPGEILASEVAAARASSHLRLTRLPATTLRGVAEPMVLVRVERP